MALPEIKWGAQLTVRESQNAIFFRDGKAQMVFTPGRHVLKTQNIPGLTKFITSFGYGPDSPFRAEVYFLNMKLFRNLKWGTKEPILFRRSRTPDGQTPFPWNVLRANKRSESLPQPDGRHAEDLSRRRCSGLPKKPSQHPD